MITLGVEPTNSSNPPVTFKRNETPRLYEAQISDPVDKSYAVAYAVSTFCLSPLSSEVRDLTIYNSNRNDNGG